LRRNSPTGQTASDHPPSSSLLLGGLSVAQRDRLGVVVVDQIGAYALLRLERGVLDPGVPGQFFMLEAPGCVLPRPFSLCQAPPDELAFLVEAIGPGTRALCALSRGDSIHVLGPLGNGFELSVDRPVLVGGGIGIAPLPYLSEALGRPRALLGFRSAQHAEAAVLVPNAVVVVEPTLVTELLEDDPGDVLACGPEPMLEAIARLVPGAQLAWEAPMACGYGACYGCVVEVDGHMKRLCVDGPVLRARANGFPTSLNPRVQATVASAGALAGRSPASTSPRSEPGDQRCS
jgi:dihydroorotate dehydrogenase electron transfer subunit